MGEVMKRVVIIASIVALSLAAAGFVVVALSSNNGEELITKVKILSIPACAFNEWYNDIDFRRQGANLNLRSGTTSYTYYAPVILPHNTVIKKIKVVCVVTQTNGNVSVYLERRANTANFDEVMASIFVNGTTSGWKMFETSNIKNSKVNNASYCYFIGVNVSGSGLTASTLQQVKIYYSGSW